MAEQVAGAALSGLATRASEKILEKSLKVVSKRFFRKIELEISLSFEILVIKMRAKHGYRDGRH